MILLIWLLGMPFGYLSFVLCYKKARKSFRKIDMIEGVVSSLILSWINAIFYFTIFLSLPNKNA